jgi:hypothetical protein
MGNLSERQPAYYEHRGSVMKMTTQEIKDVHEWAVFEEFVHAAGLGIDISTASKGVPPDEPDIRVVTREGTVYFELGRLLDDEMQEAKKKACAGKLVSTADFDVKLPLREMLLKKIAKPYQTAGAPIDLVLYYDNEDLMAGDVPAVWDFPKHADHVAKAIVSQQSLFRCVWVYERHHRTVLWKCTR